MLTLPMAGLSFREYLGMVHGLHFEPLPLADLLATHQAVAVRILECISFS